MIYFIIILISVMLLHEKCFQLVSNICLIFLSVEGFSNLAVGGCIVLGFFRINTEVIAFYTLHCRRIAEK